MKPIFFPTSKLTESFLAILLNFKCSTSFVVVSFDKDLFRNFATLSTSPRKS